MIERTKVPGHLWAIAFVSLLWNAVGVFSYMMTQTGNLASLGMNAEQIAYFKSFPAWADALWALGVWGAFLGSLLLLFQSRWALASFAISLLGLIGTTVFQKLVTTVPADLQNPVLEIAIWASTLFLLWYAMRMRKEGILR